MVPGTDFGIVIFLFYAVIAVAVIVLFILLARLLLAATRTLDTVTQERRLRIDLLAADAGDDIAP